MPSTSSRRQMWLLVPVGGLVKKFFADFEQYPYQVGSFAECRRHQLHDAEGAGRDEAAEDAGELASGVRQAGRNRTDRDAATVGLVPMETYHA